MKYLVFSYDAIGLPVALRLQQEGQSVTIGYIENKKDILSSVDTSAAEDREEKLRRLKMYDGVMDKMPAEKLIEKMKTIKDPENYFVFFDVNNLYKFAEQVQDMGFHGNFPTAQDIELEHDRNLAKEFAAKHYPSLHVGATKDFKQATDAIKFLQTSDDQWVLKGKDDHARTIVPESTDTELANRQIIEVLETDPALYEKSGFILELLIPTIVELTPEKIYYNGEPVATTIDIENKPLGSGNIGTQTGCASDMVFSTDFDAKINQIAFPPIVDEMARQHKGLFVWDASLLIDSKSGKVYFGEYCSNRFGYNSLFTEIAISGSAHGFFEKIVKGKNPFRPGVVGTSVRIFNLNTDSGTGHMTSGKQIIIQDRVMEDVWVWDIYKDRDVLKNVGLSKNIAAITAAGTSVEQTVTQLYKNLSGFAYEGGYYRPQFDYTSKDYPTSILNRLNYGLQHNLYKIDFAI
jgi:hypothetical protein